MKGSILKIKLRWLTIFGIILSETYLLAFWISGSNNVAFHAFIIALSILIEPIIVVISHRDDEKSLHHDKTIKNESNNETEESTNRYKYAYGSRYEDLHVHF